MLEKASDAPANRRVSEKSHIVPDLIEWFGVVDTSVPAVTSDVGDAPPTRPHTRSFRRMMPPTPVPLALVQVIEVRPEAPPVLTLDAQCGCGSVSLRVPAGLHAVWNP